jgi:hypothetical protein
MRKIDRLENKFMNQKVDVYYFDFEEFTTKEIGYFVKGAEESPNYFRKKMQDFFKDYGYNFDKNKWGEPLPKEKRAFQKSYALSDIPRKEAEKIKFDSTQGVLIGTYDDKYEMAREKIEKVTKEEPRSFSTDELRALLNSEND